MWGDQEVDSWAGLFEELGSGAQSQQQPGLQKICKLSCRLVACSLISYLVVIYHFLVHMFVTNIIIRKDFLYMMFVWEKNL